MLGKGVPHPPCRSGCPTPTPPNASWWGCDHWGSGCCLSPHIFLLLYSSPPTSSFQKRLALGGGLEAGVSLAANHLAEALP